MTNDNDTPQKTQTTLGQEIIEGLEELRNDLAASKRNVPTKPPPLRGPRAGDNGGGGGVQ